MRNVTHCAHNVIVDRRAAQSPLMEKVVSLDKMLVCILEVNMKLLHLVNVA